MLVLTRRPEEGIRIGEDVRIVVLEISGDRVRLGIQAPRERSILRDELFASVAEANSEAVRDAREQSEGARWLDVRHRKLGALRVPADRVIEIEAMPGFPHARRFVLLAHDRGDEIAWLASCDDTSLAFPVMDLRTLREDVCEELSPEELASVGASGSTSVELLGILNTRGGRSRINLDSPVLIHRETRRGRQLIREQPLPLR